MDVFAFEVHDRRSNAANATENEEDDDDQSYFEAEEGNDNGQIIYTGAAPVAHGLHTPPESVHNPNEDDEEEEEQLYIFGKDQVTIGDRTWSRLYPKTEHTFKFKNTSAGLAIELTPTYIEYSQGRIIMPTQNTCYSHQGSGNEAEFRSFVDSWGAAMACTEPETAVLKILLEAQETQAMIDRRSDMYRDKTAAFSETLKASNSKWSEDTGEWETKRKWLPKWFQKSEQ